METFPTSKESIHEATNDVRKIRDSLHLIGTNFNDILKSIESQTKLSENMTSNIHIINEKAFKLKDKINKSGKDIFEISRKVDAIRLNIYGIASLKMDNKTLIKVAITDHLMWKWNVYNMILGYFKIDDKVLGNHRECRLGKWIATMPLTDQRVKNIIDEIERPHSEIHEKAKIAVKAYNMGNIAESELMLNDIEKNSKIVVELLNKLSTFL